MLIFLSNGLKGRLQDCSHFTRVASERVNQKAIEQVDSVGHVSRFFGRRTMLWDRGVNIIIDSILASSRRSVSQGAARETAREKKLKKSATRGSERTPVGKLYKRSFRSLIDRLQRPVT